MTPEEIVQKEWTNEELVQMFRQALPLAIKAKLVTREEVQKATEDKSDQMKLFSKVLSWHSQNNL